MSLLETKPVLMVGPAWGRKYAEPDQARKDWEAGLDFKILVGPDMSRYCSIRDTKSLLDEGYLRVGIRLEAYPYAMTIQLEQPK